MEGYFDVDDYVETLARNGQDGEPVRFEPDES